MKSKLLGSFLLMFCVLVFGNLFDVSLSDFDPANVAQARGPIRNAIYNMRHNAQCRASRGQVAPVAKIGNAAINTARVILPPYGNQRNASEQTESGKSVCPTCPNSTESKTPTSPKVETEAGESDAPTFTESTVIQHDGRKLSVKVNKESGEISVIDCQGDVCRIIPVSIMPGDSDKSFLLAVK